MAQVNEVVRVTPRPVPIGQQPFIFVVGVRHSLQLRVEARVGVLGKFNTLLLPMMEDEALRGAPRYLEAVRMASKIEKKPPTVFSHGDESRRWREGFKTRQNTELIHLPELGS